MDALVTPKLLQLLMIGITFSIFSMALVQKIKMLPFFNKDYKIWLLNLVVSFALGIPFTLYFYQENIWASLWVSLFGFIGASTLYEALKSQNLITYKPKSSPNTNEKEDTITIPRSHQIK